MTIVLAADLGGTSVKAALVTSEGHILAQTSIPAPEPGVSGLILPPEWWNRFREAATTVLIATLIPLGRGEGTS